MENLSAFPKSMSFIYTVSQLNRETRLLLSEHFLTIQVEGEISNLSMPSSGHIYFSLKDVNAQVRCAMFRSYKRRLHFIPENGKQVIVTAQVGLYETRGDYQLIVEDMQEAGDGALRRAFEILKKKLSVEGLFATESKQMLPKLPQTIGVITSPTGAAIKDILTVIKRRFPALPVIIYPVAVQGDSAKYEIVQAITNADNRNECDVIILARGGGSLEDLWAFNEEIVAKAIFACKTPIITGIGHEIDFTIADFVADMRAPTPSAAAEHITPDRQEWLRLIQQYENRMIRRMQSLLQHHQKAAGWICKRLQQQHPGKQIQNKFQRLDELELRLNRHVQTTLEHRNIRLETLTAKLWRHHPADGIKAYTLQQQFLYRRLISAQKQLLEQKKQLLAKYRQTLHAVSPLATLQRGYAIVTKPGCTGVISSSENLKQGDMIQTRLAKGQFISQVEEIDNAQ